MKAINEFIIEVGKAFKDTISHGSLELYANHITQQNELSNRFGKVINLPMAINSEIEIGAEVIIEPTVLFKQVYRGKEQESRFLVNKQKGWYRLTPDMIILYKNPGKEWQGHNNNLFVEPIEQVEQKTASGIIIPEDKKRKDAYATVAYLNEKLKKEDIQVGDKICYPAENKFEFEFQGKTYLYLKNMHVLGKMI